MDYLLSGYKWALLSWVPDPITIGSDPEQWFQSVANGEDLCLGLSSKGFLYCPEKSLLYKMAQPSI